MPKQFVTEESKSIIDQLPSEIRILWEYFLNFIETPRESYHTEKARALVVDLANELSLESVVDEVGNVIVKKPASPGYESKPTVCIQGHMDIVPDLDPGLKHDFRNDPVRARIEDGWIRACGTSLGADNGIGLAASFALLADNTLKHGPIEALFTVDEETGLEGAEGLSPSALKCKYLINVDSEEEWKICIGCAGGFGAETEISTSRVKSDVKDMEVVHLRMDGFIGGHTGVDIAENRGNPLKFFGRMMKIAEIKGLDVSLINIEGGTADNAIPRSLDVDVCVSKEKVDEFIVMMKNEFEKISKEFKSVEKTLKLNTVISTDVGKEYDVCSKESTKQIVDYLNIAPFGPLRWSPDVEGLVESSYAVTKISMTSERVCILGSGRSSSDSQLEMLQNMMRSMAEVVGAVKLGILNPYPGWQPVVDSELLKVAKEAHNELFGKEAEVYAIHAGLECGLLMQHYPDMECISIGPNICNPHSSGEKLLIDSVPRFYKLLRETVARISS